VPPDPDRVVLIRSEGKSSGKQGVSAESAGARGISVHLVTIPPGGRAKAHLHQAHETAIYMLEGTVVTWWGEGLRQRTVTSTGDFLYIPAGLAHLPINQSTTERALALVARTDPNEQESSELLPELDDHPAPDMSRARQ
jgi:uncharacterized RmlC-like cupin family protein